MYEILVQETGDFWLRHKEYLTIILEMKLTVDLSAITFRLKENEPN